MQRGGMDDGIDESQWLSPNAAAEVLKAAEERGAVTVHYTHDGRVLSATPVLPTVLEHMDGREWLTGEEVSACREFAACRLAFQSQCGARTARYEAAYAGGTDAPGMADKYRRALRHASKADCDTAALIHDTPCPRDIWDSVYNERGRIAEALGRIAKALRGMNDSGHPDEK